MTLPRPMFAALALGIACSTAAAGGREMIDLGVAPGKSASAGVALSRDGRLVAGYSGGTGNNVACRYDSQAGTAGVLALGVVPGDHASAAHGITADGSMVVGNSSGVVTMPPHAFTWTQAGGMQVLPPALGHDLAYAFGVSPDGTVVVGASGVLAVLASDRACRWVNGVPEKLGTLLSDYASRAHAVSGNGQVVVGASATRAFRWTEESGMVNIGASMEVNITSIAWAVNHDGSVIAGEQNGRMFRWTAATGIVDLGALPGAVRAAGYGITADGSVIVGSGESAFGQRAVIWTAETGLIDLHTYLTARGVDVSQWSLVHARAITPDGRAIAGEGFHNGVYRAFLIRGLPSTCPPDVNGSGSLTVQDIFDFLAHYFAGEFEADFNLSNTLTVQDIFDFLAAYFTGCNA